MTLILHNIKVALRNLKNYKLQTLISVLSIAIGIVTFSLAHSAISRYQLPPIADEPYFDRVYMVRFKPMNQTGIDKINETRQFFASMQDQEDAKIDLDIIRALNGNGGLRNAEKIAVPNSIMGYLDAEFHLPDSTILKGGVDATIIDPEYPEYSGLRSAVTGEKIRKLKKGEAIISKDLNRKIFGDRNPVGAVQVHTDDFQSLQVTITDVFESVPILENIFRNDVMYFCLSDSIEEYYPFQYNYAAWIDVVIREGSTEKELQKEIDVRVVPLGLKSDLTRVKDNPSFKNVIPIRLLIHTIGALILLAAIIGFLRIEIQLFHIRRRELALRITNGATRRQAFGCLVTEILIVIVLSVLVALMLGTLLQDFIDTRLIHIFGSSRLVVKDLWSISIVTGCFLLIICSLIAWITLSRMMKSGKGLATNMRRSRSHLFRNAMLCIQILICMVFLCCAFILVKGGKQVLDANNVPERNREFAEYFTIKPVSSSDPKHLMDEISRLPDLEKMVVCDHGYTAISELYDNPEIMEKINGKGYHKTYFTSDTTLLSTLGMTVKWNGRDIDRNQCFLLSEKTAAIFNELGVLDKLTLTLKFYNLTLPIAGTVSNFPYDNDGKFLVAIYPEWDADCEYLLVPKEGRNTALKKSIEKTVKRVEPQNFNEMIFGFRENLNPFPSMVEAARAVGWILAFVSLIICGMSIFSTIALDTRARRKEVAVRKVNGAKSHDIYRMFGRTYAVLLLVSLIIAIPVCVLFNQVVESFIQNTTESTATLSPAIPILLAILTVILMTFMIVYRQIHRVMRLDPSTIIAKE